MDADKVHPTPGGHGLMGKIWLEAVGFECNEQMK